MSDWVGAYATGLFDSNNSCASKATATAMAASVMTDYIFWSIHVDAEGNLHYNNVELVSNGVVSKANANCLKAVSDAGRSSGNMKRTWLSIGAGGTSDFTNISKILNEGGKKKTELLGNFQAIVEFLGIYGFDYDNEDQIGNVDVIVDLTTALHGKNNGYRFSFCPYLGATYWIECLQKIYLALGTQPVVGFNLQCYSGGDDNDPSSWVNAVTDAGSNTTGITHANALIRPGLAVKGCANGPDYSPSEMTTQLQAWSSQGAWIWNTEHVMENNGGSPSIAEYAEAIVKGT